MAVRWYLAYSLSYRDIEELMAERGVAVDHSTLNPWVVHYALLLEDEFRKNHKRQVGQSWRMDETYIKVQGVWHYLYRAVDKDGDTVDFMLSEKRDKAAAKAFFIKAIGSNGLLEKITIDKSGANKAGIDAINIQHCIFLAWIPLRLIKLIRYLKEKSDVRGKIVTKCECCRYTRRR